MATGQEFSKWISDCSRNAEGLSHTERALYLIAQAEAEMLLDLPQNHLGHPGQFLAEYLLGQTRWILHCRVQEERDLATRVG
jgi:hypothetical protein